MLTTKVISVEMKTGTLRVPPAAILIAILVGTLCGIFCITDWPVRPDDLEAPPATASASAGR